MNGMTRRRFGMLAGGAALGLGVDLAGLPGRAWAAAGFRYGVNHPNGTAAVDYAYGPDGMWRPLVDVSYRWNYYQQYATPTHPYDPAALIAYADGTHLTTARDAGGHLLLDFNHDGEIDVTGGGAAFCEHYGRGAGNTVLANPFTNVWFDDNWLARYMALAYGRTLPYGLSAYPTSTGGRSWPAATPPPPASARPGGGGRAPGDSPPRHCVRRQGPQKGCHLQDTHETYLKRRDSGSRTGHRVPTPPHSTTSRRSVG